MNTTLKPGMKGNPGKPKGVRNRVNRNNENEILSTPTGFCQGVLGFPTFTTGSAIP
jgi:hypothetical protein